MTKKNFRPLIVSWGAILLFSLAATAGEAGAAGQITGAVKTRGVKNPTDVVIYIEKVDGQFQPQKTPVPVDQVKRTYVPHVMAVLVGSEIEFLNSDDNDLHNIHARHAGKKLFNFGIPPRQKVRRTLKQEGIVTLLCDVHPEMSAFIVVTQNPFFSKPDDKGNYTIKNVPPGSYTLKAWHENLKPESKEVKVSEGGKAQVDFELRR
jgi:plastocyanin